MIALPCRLSCRLLRIIDQTHPWPMASLQEVVAWKASASPSHPRVASTARYDAIARICMPMAIHGLAVADVTATKLAKTNATGGKESMVAAEDRNPATGNHWSGRACLQYPSAGHAACFSCTDTEPATLTKRGKFLPWRQVPNVRGSASDRLTAA
jgi:hypothetical protein